MMEILLFDLVFYGRVIPVSVSTLKPLLRVSLIILSSVVHTGNEVHIWKAGFIQI